MERIWAEHDAGYVHERLGGAAVWVPPGSWLIGPLQTLRLVPPVVGVLRGGSPRLVRAHVWMERKHPKRPEHWYLPVIGVAPEWQGRGFGQALLQPMLRQCDQEGVPAYLEASTPRNRALYERNGFRCVEEGVYAKSAPPLWRMWREPRAHHQTS
jgi:GNAT superfamily N-acetyltransferase